MYNLGNVFSEGLNTYIKPNKQICLFVIRTSKAKKSKREWIERKVTKKRIYLNAFDMNCVSHMSPGLWAHPEDQSNQYNNIE